MKMLHYYLKISFEKHRTNDNIRGASIMSITKMMRGRVELFRQVGQGNREDEIRRANEIRVKARHEATPSGKTFYPLS